MTLLAAVVPLSPPPVAWRSTSYAARFYNRSEIRIRCWCREGRFAAVGIPVFRDAIGRWWIRIPLEGEIPLTDADRRN